MTNQSESASVTKHGRLELAPDSTLTKFQRLTHYLFAELASGIWYAPRDYLNIITLRGWPSYSELQGRSNLKNVKLQLYDYVLGNLFRPPTKDGKPLSWFDIRSHAESVIQKDPSALTNFPQNMEILIRASKTVQPSIGEINFANLSRDLISMAYSCIRSSNQTPDKNQLRQKKEEFQQNIESLKNLFHAVHHRQFNSYLNSMVEGTTQMMTLMYPNMKESLLPLNDLKIPPISKN